jgi:excisionase family DNA binding protein
MGSPDDLLTITEVADQYRVSRMTVGRWVKAGRLPAIRLAGLRALRVRREDVEAIAVPIEPVEPTPLPRRKPRQAS